MITLITGAVYALYLLVKILLEGLYYRATYQDQRPPESLSEGWDKEKLERASDYNRSKSTLRIISLLLGAGIFFGFLFSPVAAGVQKIFLPLGFWGEVLYLGGLLTALTLISLPLSLYNKLVLEQKFGFNRQGAWGIVIDSLKGLVFTLVLTLGLFSAFNALLGSLPTLWWLAGWAVYTVFSLVFFTLGYRLFSRMFNRFSSLPEGELRNRLEALGSRLDFPVKDILVMDASRRSSHSNAYFTGFGKSREIVLFDTLIEKHTPEELEAVLAHEIGHYKKKHILKSYLITSILSLGVFYTLHLSLSWTGFFGSFGLTTNLSALMVFLYFLQSPFILAAGPLINGISRHNEYEADAYAKEAMGSPEPLVKALARLSTSNLSLPKPDPIYALFYYSHPTLSERVGALEQS